MTTAATTTTQSMPGQAPHISLFSHFCQVEGNRSLEKVVAAIASDLFQAQVEEVRELMSKRKVELASQKKRQLLGFTVSGRFRGGRTMDHLVEYSRYLVLDFDKLAPAPLQALRQALRHDRFVLAGFTSPSGNGYKAIVRVDSDLAQHEQAFEQVACYFEQLLEPIMGPAGTGLDRSGKDVTRLCFVSYDPDAWIDPAKEVFHVEPTASPRPASPTTASPTTASPAGAGPDEGTERELQGIFEQTLAKIPYEPGNRNNFVYYFASNANRAGVAEADAIDFATRHCYGLPAQELRQAFKSAYYHHRHEHASAPPKPREEGPPPGQDDLLLNMPLLDDRCFAHLPSLLHEGCRVFNDLRERDVFLTGALAVLSGCLEGIDGVYDRRDTFPNLFAFVVAPAASGKSALSFAKQLGDDAHRALLDENRVAQAQYQQDMADHKQRLSAHKAGRNLPPEPEKPPFRLLFVPANTSSAMVIQHLRDNGGNGIMFETEADTLSSVLKQDWGGYSDLLRKAFHFEKVSYSRKGGQEFFEIERPRLSVAISGTPAQVLRLIPSSEDGLFSRFIFYCFAVQPLWRDVSPANGGLNLTGHFARLSGQTTRMARFNAMHPAQFHLSATQWWQLNTTFSRILRESNLLSGSGSLSSVKRLGAMLFRIAMTLTAIRRFDLCNTEPSVTCGEDDFQTAHLLVQAYLRHALLLFEALPREETPALRRPTDRSRHLFDALPDSFSRRDAVSKGIAIGISERSVDRFLSILTNAGLLVIRLGGYLKTPPA